MPGVRLDRFLASTAVLLALALPPGHALSAPLSDTGAGSAGAVADPSTTPPADSAEPAQPAAPASSSDLAPSAAAPEAKPTATDATESVPSPGAKSAVTEAGQSAAAPDAKPTAADEAAPAAATEGKPAVTDAGASATLPDAKPVTTDSAAPVVVPAAAAENPTTALAAAAASVDSPIAEQLHALAEGKFDRIIGGKKERTTIEAFYSGRNYAPIWTTDGKLNERGKAAIAYLGHVDADGLDPADYPVPNFQASSDPAALAEAEVKLTSAIVTYAHHASVGRVHWSRVSADISYNTTAPDAADVLASIVAAKDVGAALDAYEPHTPGYLALKAKLAELRGGKGDPAGAPIASGPVLKIGMQDERVPALRQRLGVLGDGGTTYDKTLAAAVKKFQQEHELAPSGTLTPTTVEALDGHTSDRQTDIILANMERWRWMPHDLGKTYVIVNLPDYTLRVMHDGKQVWMTKIVIGKPAMPTPIMSAEMKYITINPTWNVPPSIVNREYLPALSQDPTVIERMGLKVGRNPDGTVHIWQPPGDKNALGRIRFNFPNKFLVYQHDTPDKNLFASAERAFSHGCMRVQDPTKYAEVLLSLVRPGDSYTEERIKKMFGPNETDIQLPNYIPVNLTYQTAFVDDAGKLEFRDDIYGRDKALVAIMKGDERKVADIAVEHKEDITHRQVLALPDQPSLWGGSSGRSYYAGGGGDNFFSRLFGNPFAAPPPPPRPIPHSRESRYRASVER